MFSGAGLFWTDPKLSFQSFRACSLGERVTLASGLKLALVYKQISQVGGYPITWVNFASFTDLFRHA